MSKGRKRHSVKFVLVEIKRSAAQKNRKEKQELKRNIIIERNGSEMKMRMKMK